MDTGDSGLLDTGTCEFLRENKDVEGSALAQLGTLSVVPAWDAGEEMVGKTCIDLASVVNSASSVEVRSHMMVFIVVILICVAGGTRSVSGGRLGCCC